MSMPNEKNNPNLDKKESLNQPNRFPLKEALEQHLLSARIATNIKGIWYFHLYTRDWKGIEEVERDASQFPWLKVGLVCIDAIQYQYNSKQVLSICDTKGDFKRLASQFQATDMPYCFIVEDDVIQYHGPSHYTSRIDWISQISIDTVSAFGVTRKRVGTETKSGPQKGSRHAMVDKVFSHKMLFQDPSFFCSYTDWATMASSTWYVLFWKKSRIPQLPLLQSIWSLDTCVFVVQVDTGFEHEDVFDSVDPSDASKVHILNNETGEFKEFHDKFLPKHDLSFCTIVDNIFHEIGIPVVENGKITLDSFLNPPTTPISSEKSFKPMKLELKKPMPWQEMIEEVKLIGHGKKLPREAPKLAYFHFFDQLDSTQIQGLGYCVSDAELIPDALIVAVLLNSSIEPLELLSSLHALETNKIALVIDNGFFEELLSTTLQAPLGLVVEHGTVTHMGPSHSLQPVAWTNKYLDSPLMLDKTYFDGHPQTKFKDIFAMNWLHKQKREIPDIVGSETTLLDRNVGDMDLDFDDEVVEHSLMAQILAEESEEEDVEVIQVTSVVRSIAQVAPTVNTAVIMQEASSSADSSRKLEIVSSKPSSHKEPVVELERSHESSSYDLSCLTDERTFCFWNEEHLLNLISQHFAFYDELLKKDNFIAPDSVQLPEPMNLLMIHFAVDGQTFDEVELGTLTNTFKEKQDYGGIIIQMGSKNVIPSHLNTGTTGYAVLQDRDGIFYQFYQYTFGNRGPVCIILHMGAITYIGPSIGHLDFVGFPAPHYISPTRFRNWRSPLLNKPFAFDTFFNKNTMYLSTKKITAQPQVLIIHCWSVFCEASQTNFDKYDVLRKRIPNATHILMHVERRWFHSPTEKVLAALPKDLHPDFVLVKDQDHAFLKLIIESEYVYIPNIFIIVNGVIRYLGMQHIECHPQLFPGIVQDSVMNDLTMVQSSSTDRSLKSTMDITPKASSNDPEPLALVAKKDQCPCDVEKSSDNKYCYWNNQAMKDMIGKQFIHQDIIANKLNFVNPEMCKFPIISSKLWVHFAVEDWDLSDFEQVLEEDPDLSVLVVNVTPNHRNLESIDLSKMGLINENSTLENFYHQYFSGLGPVCILLYANGSVTYVGPSAGHPSYEVLPVHHNLPIYKHRDWRSPLLGTSFDFDLLFNKDTMYLHQSRHLTKLPKVLIILTWSTFCNASQRNWDDYEALRQRLPSATYVLYHMDRPIETTPFEKVQSLVPPLHPDFILVSDHDHILTSLVYASEYRCSPCTFIIVHGRIVYVGRAHIACNPQTIPNFVANALEKYPE